MVRRRLVVVLTLHGAGRTVDDGAGHADLAANEELLAGNPTLHVSAEEEYRVLSLCCTGSAGSKRDDAVLGLRCWPAWGFDVYIPDLPGHGAQTCLPMADSPGTGEPGERCAGGRPAGLNRTGGS